MRIFGNFVEAVDEVERELLEMGHAVDSHSFQNVVTENNPNYRTRELMGYSFMITDISGLGIINLIKRKNLNIEWLAEELDERISGKRLNPGQAWKLRLEDWQQFLTPEGEFDYTYSERLCDQLDMIIKELRVRPNSRQAILQMYRHDLDHPNLGGKARIPCTMYYQLMIRNSVINIIYTMRSSDFYTHFPYDITLAAGLANHIGEELGIPIGSGIYFFGSLHAFEKDLKARGVF